MSHYSHHLKDKVKLLRFVDGLSLGQIQKVTHVPKSTISTWVAGTPLTVTQIEKIKLDALRLLQEGRIKSQKIQRENRDSKAKGLMSNGILEVGQLDNRDFLIAGIALYWAEGFKNKHERRLGFCNSDPSMIKFYLYWLKSVLGVENKDLVARLALNVAYKEKARSIEQYWSQTTGIPLSQFSKTFFQQSQWKKQYNTENYHGVLRIHVKGSLDNFLKMKGWIEGLRINLPG
jgi:hypothetical protein